MSIVERMNEVAGMVEGLAVYLNELAASVEDIDDRESVWLSADIIRMDADNLRQKADFIQRVIEK